MIVLLVLCVCLGLLWFMNQFRCKFNFIIQLSLPRMMLHLTAFQLTDDVQHHTIFSLDAAVAKLLWLLVV